MVHVVRVGDAEVGIEAVRGREHFGMVAEVPFAKAGGGVALLLQMVGDGVLGRVQADGRSGKEHALVHAHPFRIAAGEQCRPRRRADRRGDHEAGEPAPFSGEPVEMRRADRLRAKAPEVAVALVIGEDDDDVRLRGGKGLSAGERDGCEECE